MRVLDIQASQLPEPWRRALEAQPALEAEVGRKLEAARQAWPEIALSDELFVAHLAGLGDGDEPVEQIVEDTRFEDLYLACAAAQGDPAAMERLERAHLRKLARRACDRDGAISVDELCQSLRAHLFVAAGERPAKIAQYQGRGSLRNWLRMVVGRHLQNLCRAGAREVAVDDESLADALVDGGDSPELAYMRRLYLQEYRRAFASAARRLEARQRTLLRLSAVDHLGIDRIASIYGVHRSTAARWLARARDVLIAELRRELCKQIAVSDSQLESILVLIESRVHVTLERVLATQSGEVDET